MNSDEIRVKILKALADEGRLKIIRILANSHREMTCGEIAAHLNLSDSTVSYHLRAMREAGLTNTRKDAQTRLISINEATFAQYLPGFLTTLTDS